MTSETKKNWLELALSSCAADVYCTRELSRVNVPVINPAVPCVESATQASKQLAQKPRKGSKRCAETKERSSAGKAIPALP